MPNWCENDLTVEGPKEVIEEFLRFAAGESPFDFNKFVPYPEEFQRLDDAAEAWDKEHAEQPDCDRRQRPKDGFNSGGFEWRVEHWGTKWPAFHVDTEGPVTGYDGKTLEVVFHFDTAWSPPRRSSRTRPNASGAHFRAAVLRVRRLLQRVVSLQRGRRRDGQERRVFREPRRMSCPAERTGGDKRER